MAINYTWNVSTVDVKEIDGNADTVFNVHWRLTGTDDANNDADGGAACLGLELGCLAEYEPGSMPM